MKRILSFVLCAAMLLSSIVFVTGAASPEVQAVIDKIDAIGEVHRNEALLENLSFDSYMFNAYDITNASGYAAYARIDYPTGGHNVDQNRPDDFLLWDRDFQVTFQFVPAEFNLSGGTPYFGGKIDNKGWLGYNFKTQKFFIGKSTDGGPGGPSSYVMQSDVTPLSPDRAYTVTFLCTSAGFSVILDGEVMCTTIGQPEKLENGKTNKKYFVFKPYEVNNNAYEWKHFIMWPSFCTCYLLKFEASSLDGVKKVNNLATDIQTNGVLQPKQFTTNAYVDSGDLIAAAKSAYMALTPPQKKEVTNYSTLVEKMRQYYTIQPAYGDEQTISEDALAVVDLIDAIGNVTFASEDDIYCAEVEYEALTPEQQEEVYNYDVLLCSREEFDSFSDPAITKLIADINAIAPVTLDSGTAIARAEADYASFNSAQQSAVTNYADLLEYRAQYDTLCVNRVREVWSSIGTVTKESAEIMALARQLYSNLRDDLKPRVADLKPIFDAAKTDFRILNLDECDITDSDPNSEKGIWEIIRTGEYYEIQSAAAKQLVKQKAFLDERVLEATHKTEADQLVKLIDRIGTVRFMEPNKTAQGLEFAAKSSQGYSNIMIRKPAGTDTSSGLFAPYIVSLDIVIKKWLYNEDDMTARICAFLPDYVAGYNAHEKKFMIGDSHGFAGQEEVTNEYGESKVVELKLGVPYNITYEIDENHIAIFLNGKKMVESTEVGLKRIENEWFIFYPAGVDFLVTGYSFIHNGEVIADNVNGSGLITTEPKFDTTNRWSWVNNNGGWKNGAISTFDPVYRDSGYMVETAYNRYLALPDEFKQYVTNSAVLLEKYNEYSTTKNESLVAEAIQAIEAIGDPTAVTLGSLEAIEHAEYCYGEVPEDKLAEVTNYSSLTSARANYDKVYAADFDARVNAVGDVSAEKFETIENLDAEYQAMSEAQKALVTSLAVLKQLVKNCAEFYTAQPVIEAIYSFQGLRTANYNDTTTIGGGVRKTDNDPYTHFDKMGPDTETVKGTIISSRRYKVEFDFMYTSYDDARYASISGSNDSVLAGVDLGHNLVFIKNNAGPFGNVDPDTYDAKAAFTFRTYRWYHVTVNYDALNISVEINGEKKVSLELSDFSPGPWYIMKPHGGVHGYLDNMSASTLVPEDELEDGFVRTVYQDNLSDTTIPETTIGQWNRDNVARARAMYNALSPFARTAVTNYSTLEDTERLLGIAAPSEAAMAVIDAINLLDKDSTLDDVNAVKAQYDALSAADKKAVTNYEKIDEILALLQNEEAVDEVIAMIDALSDESSVADIVAAKEAYDALPASNKDKVTNSARIGELLSAKLQHIIDMIAALTTDSSVDDVSAAKAAYDALPDDLKEQITNVDHLNEILAGMESKIAVANVQAKIDAIDDTTSYEIAKEAENAYKALTDDQKALITGYERIAARYAAIAKAVEDKIAALTTSSTDNEIDLAEIAYVSLPDELKALVPNYDHLQEIKNSHVSEAATEVIEMIMELDVNSTMDQVQAAIDAYNALSDRDKAAVWNYKNLQKVLEDKAADIIARIDELPDVYYIDIYHYEKDVTLADNEYNALPDAVKELVTNYDKLKAAVDKIAELKEWNDNKKVNILNSTLAGFAKYTPEKLEELANTKPMGLYYYFEEVDQIERGDSTSGYYSLDGDKDNALVKDTKYAKLELDIKVTDVDLINGWPAFFKMSTGFENGWIGYDFVNKTFFHSFLGNGGGAGMDHGTVVPTAQYTPHDFEFGVWHHMVLTWDEDHATIEFDGETVLDLETPDLYEWLIIYPWLCNLEMTNVYLYAKDGNKTLSPFRNAINYPSGWSKSANDPDTTMLDLVKETIEDAKTAYGKLSDAEKEQIIGYENVDKLEKMIENLGKFTVTVEGGSADPEAADEGATVTITAAEAPEGMVFDKWEIVSGEIELADASAASTTFTMPGSSVTVKATYKESTVKAGDVNGDGKLNAKDVTSIMKYLVNNAPAKFDEAAADFNGDGKVNAKDVTGLMKYLVANPS